MKSNCSNNTFEISNNGFLYNGKPTQLISGAMHYFRIHPDSWEDRMVKMKGMGLNTLETYVPWNLHEPRSGEFDFSGFLDVEKYIRIAQKHDLMVIFRPGPYICSEWDFGGLPAWLLKDPAMKVRCFYEPYIEALDRFFDELIGRIKPLQITHGGPVIMVQIENEYGSYGNDKKYLRHIEKGLIKRGIDVPLFTSDGYGETMLIFGTLPHVFKTVNFGSRPADAFAQLRKHQSDKPMMCMEFWNGWFDHWGGEHHVRSAADAANVLDEMLAAGASVNFYMFHGGTNFGFMSGANMTNDGYSPTITSYDFDAPLNEAGDITPKYLAYRDVIAKYKDVGPLPEIESKKIALPAFVVDETLALFEALPQITKPYHLSTPVPMEMLDQNYGFILYKTVIKGTNIEHTLSLRGLHDRALIFIDGEYACTMYRNDKEYQWKFTTKTEGTTIEILVENCGRVNYGRNLHDRKGIAGDVCFGDVTLFDWEITTIPLNNINEISRLAFARGAAVPENRPHFYKTSFELEIVGDTFLHLPTWKKGVCWINGFNLGRYWAIGPQHSLYIPAGVLKKGKNELIILELHSAGNGEVELRDTPNLGK